MECCVFVGVSTTIFSINNVRSPRNQRMLLFLLNWGLNGYRVLISKIWNTFRSEESSSVSTIMYNSSDESPFTCNHVMLVIMMKFKIAGLTVCAVLATTTLVMIASNRRLRKQQNIFPFNLVLADLAGVVTFMIVDIRWLRSDEEVRLVSWNPLPSQYPYRRLRSLMIT